MLALDTGNSRTKWAVFDANGLVAERGAVDNGALLQLPLRHLANACLEIHGRRRAVVCCVAAAQVRTQLAALLAETGFAVAWAVPQAAACGVRNGYAAPRQLGADRWAALVAAWQRQRGACVVVNAGTALTVDALSAQGEFLGGLIVPGFTLMQRALSQGTAAVPLGEGRWQEFPASTADAVHSGSLMALAGAVAGLRARLAAREGGAVACVCSGGDAGLLAPLLAPPVIMEPDLVLHGLFLLESTL